jgi:hypothetical protein
VGVDINNSQARQTFLRRVLPEAIDSLEERAFPRWGEMGAQHMVEHLTWAFELSTGASEVVCFVPEGQRERMKAGLYVNRATPRGFKNPALPEAPPALRCASLAAAKAKLREELERFLRDAQSHPESSRMHPLLGPLGVEEWERCHYRHCTHHLIQFGLVPEEDGGAPASK